MTNASSGAFSETRQFWFSVGEGEQLRLSVNGREQYRGPGPSSVELAAVRGEETYVEVVAERHSPPPEELLLEQRRFTVLLDALPPSPPVFSVQAQPDGTLSLLCAVADGSEASAFVSRNGGAAVPLILPPSSSLSTETLSLVAWACDKAGNYSSPVVFDWEPAFLHIANPLPGVWANRQTLVLQSEAGSELFYSTDGSDPLDAGGIRYTGPVFIDKAGSIHLRCASRSGDGRVLQKDVRFSVTDTLSPDLAFLSQAERAPIERNTLFELPVGTRWDTAAVTSVPYFTSEKPVVLRPIPGISRPYPLLVSSGQSLSRFIFTLTPSNYSPSIDTPSINTPELQAGGSPPDARSMAASTDGETSVHSASEPPVPEGSSVTLVSSGRIRAAFWPEGRVRFRFAPRGTELPAVPWSSAAGPFSLPVSGGDLEWLIDRGARTEGPFRLSADDLDRTPLAVTASSPSGSILSTPVTLTVTTPSRLRLCLTPLDGASLPVIAPVLLETGVHLVLDASEGEELSLEVLTEEGQVLYRCTLDRRSPPLPLLSAPPEGEWLSTATTVGASSPENTVRAYLSWTDSDGTVQEKELSGPCEIAPTRDGPVTYNLASWAIDAAGNRSQTVTRTFTLDAATVYLRVPPDGKRPSAEDGSRSAPFSDLASALRVAVDADRPKIHLAGNLSVDSDLELPAGVFLEGGFDQSWNRGKAVSLISFSGGSGLSIQGGTVSLSSLSLADSAARTEPLVRVGNGASLMLRSVNLNARGPLFAIEDGTLHATGLEVHASGPLFTARDSHISLAASRCELSSLLPGKPFVSLDRSSLEVDTCVFSLSSPEKALGFNLRDSSLRARSLSADVTSSRYSSVFDAQGSTLGFTECNLKASAQDVSLLYLDGCETTIELSRLTVAGRGVASAVEAKGKQAVIRSSTLISSGGSNHSEALSGAEPGPSSVSSTAFIGWVYLFADRYSCDDGLVFDRHYAPKGVRNTVLEAPSQ